MSEKQRYPLSWPDGWKRTANRRQAQFGRHRKEFDSQLGEMLFKGKARLNIEDAFDRVEEELRALSVEEATVLVSTNLRVNMRGIPAGNQQEPSDPGVAVYWTRKGKSQCMAIDAYYRVADNLAAVAATLEAMRAIERHGGAQILERAFLGFAQLPESRTGRSWREVMNFGLATPTRAMVAERYKTLARARHPDAGGNSQEFDELVKAKEKALREVVE